MLKELLKDKRNIVTIALVLIALIIIWFILYKTGTTELVETEFGSVYSYIKKNEGENPHQILIFELNGSKQEFLDTYTVKSIKHFASKKVDSSTEQFGWVESSEGTYFSLTYDNVNPFAGILQTNIVIKNNKTGKTIRVQLKTNMNNI
jgi:hypothetical protein